MSAKTKVERLAAVRLQPGPAVAGHERHPGILAQRLEGDRLYGLVAFDRRQLRVAGHAAQQPGGARAHAGAQFEDPPAGPGGRERGQEAARPILAGPGESGLTCRGAQAGRAAGCRVGASSIRG
ncbi:hypothetical protein [Streptomyces sp. NPDC051636]|uniref:hypothetical protein n=1 Tax=Streptomyces sp. NPDC051636 TaxID=3365663 RepID=UPI003797E3CB